MKNYIKNIRTKIGHDKIIHPAARILVENNQGQFLFVRRVDNGQLGIPAGAIEEGETIEQCITREVKEETGLELLNMTIIGISSNPEIETVSYPNGDIVQYFSIEFYSNSWKGEIKLTDPSEVKSAAFMQASNLQQLPVNERSIVDSWRYYRDMGKVMLK